MNMKEGGSMEGRARETEEGCADDEVSKTGA